MPHTCIPHTLAQGMPIACIQEIGVVRCPTVLKTSTFSCKDGENTFYVRITITKGLFCITNVEKFLYTNNTWGGHCAKKKDKFL